MTDKTRSGGRVEGVRPVPHINHTPELEAAMIAVTNAKVDGKAVNLTNPMNVHQVRENMLGISSMFEDPGFFFESDSANELVAVENLILLATLLREHLRAGNVA